MSCYVKFGKLICNNEDNKQNNIEHFKQKVTYCVPKYGECSVKCGGGIQLYTGPEYYSGPCPKHIVGQTKRECNAHPCLPQGSYKTTCKECKHNDRTLDCLCQKHNGHWNRSSITCGNNKFKNKQSTGELKCEFP